MGTLERITKTGSANADATLSTEGKTARRLIMVTVQYSAAPTQSGVTVALDSGAGADYDITLSTGSANAQSTVYIPSGDVIIKEDDAITVTAPAGGAGITASIAIYTKQVGF